MCISIHTQIYIHTRIPYTDDQSDFCDFKEDSDGTFDISFVQI